MRLQADEWSSPSQTALELIPCGRFRPTAAYFRAGHLLLDWLARSLAGSGPAAGGGGALAGSVRPLGLTSTTVEVLPSPW
jgi:hypothetical protein